jgi:ParB family chromosome partitioning protein
MAKSLPRLVLDPVQAIPLDLIDLSQANVRRIKNGVSIEALADDIDRRGLLQSLNVRPSLDAEGQATGRFESPAGGRRYAALQILVKRKRLAKDAPVPCVVKAAAGPVSAEEDSYAENALRERLHPLDEFRAMQTLRDKGDDAETIAATFGTTAAVVTQRLKLAAVSTKLHDVYAADGMTLEQLMAFAVSDDHDRQEQIWDLGSHGYTMAPKFIRDRLTEASVRATDRRARFVSLDAYLAAGGGVMRDLFEEDDGGWLSDVGLLERLVDERLNAEGERILAEGWKWVTVSRDLPYGFERGLREIDGTRPELSDAEQARVAAIEEEAGALEDEWQDIPELPAEIAARINALDTELAGLVDRPSVYDADEIARAGAFVTFDQRGTLLIERGYVRPEDEPPVEQSPDPVTGEGVAADAVIEPGQPGEDGRPTLPAPSDDSDEELVKPLPDRIVAELTATRTLALQDVFAQSPSTAFVAMLHAMVLSTFFLASRESCLGISINRALFAAQSPGLKDSPAATAIADRHARWRDRLPNSDRDIWDALQQLDATEQAALFAHCAAYAVNACWEPAPKYDNGRTSAHMVARRIEHAHVLARTVGLDMVAAGWVPTVGNYFGGITKPRILEAVAEAKGAQTAGLIEHLKKDEMAREAERLLADAGWLPEPLRTPVIDDPADDGHVLPAFLAEGADEPADFAVAAE